jgi:hypothetical protein
MHAASFTPLRSIVCRIFSFRSGARGYDTERMFDNLLRELKRMEQPQSIEVKVELDDEGYWDRLCPAPECGASFKVMLADWKSKVPDERAWCAICGEIADPSDFQTPEQHEYFVAQATAYAQERLGAAIRRDAQRPAIDNGLIKISMSYEPGARVVVVPADATPMMTQRSECEQCGCRYASIGAAFFCPACGHNSARTMFAGALATVRLTMDLADRAGELVENRDQAVDAARHFAETGLSRVWSSFQRYVEAAYESHPASAATPARKNAFQNLAESDALWKGAIGKTYGDFLTPDEIADLVRLVQARHVLSHKDGLVDADYVNRSGDGRYSVGQRLVVATRDARKLADLTEKLQLALDGEASLWSA